MQFPGAFGFHLPWEGELESSVEVESPCVLAMANRFELRDRDSYILLILTVPLFV